MATKLEEARRLLATRLDEVDRERSQLQEAIGRLDGLIDGEGKATKTRRAASRGRGSSRGTSRRSDGKRARRGQREKQLLSSIKSHPEYRVADHARAVGVSPQQLYPLLNKLIAKDVIVKKDSKYAAKG